MQSSTGTLIEAPLRGYQKSSCRPSSELVLVLAYLLRRQVHPSDGSSFSPRDPLRRARAGAPQ